MHDLLLNSGEGRAGLPLRLDRCKRGTKRIVRVRNKSRWHILLNSQSEPGLVGDEGYTNTVGKYSYK